MPNREHPEELYRLLVESVEDYAIFALDCEGHVISWNPGAERFKGYTASEVTGRHFSLFYPEEDLLSGKPQGQLEAASTLGRLQDEGWRVRKDGSRFWANVVISAIRDEDGKLVGFAKVTRDLSSQRAAADRLRELTTAADVERAARSRAEQLQRLTAALSVATSPESVADAAMESVQQALECTGVVICLITGDGQHLKVIRASGMQPDLLEAFRTMPLDLKAPLTDAAREGRSIFLESRAAWSKDYPELVYAVERSNHHAQMVAPLIVGGRCIGALGAAFDDPHTFSDDIREFAVSVAGQCAVALERARLFEGEQAAREAAESANKAKGDFLAAMSHELRTPLNAIAGHVDLLSMAIYGPVTEPQADALNRVKRATHHLTGVIDDLLSFARIEGGKVEYHLRPVVLQDVLGDVATMVGPQISAKELQYEVQLPNSPVEVMADSEKLVQVILNLVSNAVKFTPPRGRITIEARGPRDRGEKVRSLRLRVSDTGIGIPADKLEEVFDPFVQLGSAHAERHNGTGLGLAISRNLARGMGAELTAMSETGKGATFVLELPLAGEQAQL